MLASAQDSQGSLADAAALNHLGVSLRLAARPNEAIPKFDEAIKIAQSSGDDRLLATALGGLGAALVDLGEFARAQPVLRRSLALFEKTTGANSLDTGAAANNLAMAYRKTGDPVQAQAELERALPVMQKYLDPHSPELAILCNNMFDVLVEQKQWDAAEPYLLRALDIAKSGPASPAFADIYENQALLQAHRGRLRDAVQTMQQAIAVKEQTLGPDDPRLVSSLESYAGYLKKAGQKSAAKQAEDRARTLRRTGL